MCKVYLSNVIKYVEKYEHREFSAVFRETRESRFFFHSCIDS